MRTFSSRTRTFMSVFWLCIYYLFANTSAFNSRPFPEYSHGRRYFYPDRSKSCSQCKQCEQPVGIAALSWVIGAILAIILCIHPLWQPSETLAKKRAAAARRSQSIREQDSLRSTRMRETKRGASSTTTTIQFKGLRCIV